MMGLCSGSGTGRDVEVQSRLSQPDRSEKSDHTGVWAVAWHAGAPAGEEDSRMRGRGSKGRLATHRSFYQIGDGSQESHCRRR